MEKDIIEFGDGDQDVSLMSLDDRMKFYEHQGRKYLPVKEPVFIRLDGAHFHTFCNGFDKPFDDNLINAFKHTCLKLAENIQNVKLIYAQSDEITIMLNDFEGEKQSQWFEGNKQKIESISASMATAYFNEYMFDNYWGKVTSRTRKLATFDSRAWSLPRRQVANVFIWRQMDCIKNSVSMHAQSLYSHNKLMHKSTNDKKVMIIEVGEDWNQLPTHKQRGFCIYKVEREIKIGQIPEKFNKKDLLERDGEFYFLRSKWFVDNEIPEFIKDQDFVWDKLAIPMPENHENVI